MSSRPTYRKTYRTARRQYVIVPQKAPVRKRPAAKKTFARAPWYSPHMAALGGTLGGVYGGPVGGAVGAIAGKALASGLKSVTGYGPYYTSHVPIEPGRVPRVKNGALGAGSIRISHREYLGDIVSSSTTNTFKLQSFPIQPGDPNVFPWLSQLATNFQQYRIRGLLFEFKSMSADALNSTNTALGNVIMATNYNSASANFGSRAEMENCEFSQTVKPSDSCVHLIECSKSASPLTELYVRSDVVPSGDVRFFDFGVFQIASSGCQGTNVNLGSLYVSYEVELLKPVLSDALGDTGMFAHFNSTVGVVNSAPLGTGNIAPVSSTINGVTISASGLVLTIPQFSYTVSYIVRFRWTGSPAVITAPSFTMAGANGAVVNIYVGSSYNQTDAPAAGVTAGVYEHTIAYSWTGYSNNANTITVGAAGSLPTSITGFDCFIDQIPNGSI